MKAWGGGLAGLLVAAVWWPMTAPAQWYAGAAYVHSIVERSANATVATPALMLKGGYDLKHFLALEARVMSGVGTGSRVDSGVETRIDLGNSYGLFLKLATGTHDFRPYLAAGYVKGDLQFERAGGSSREDDNSAAYGFGLDAILSESMMLNLELMQYYNANDVTVTGVGLGVTGWF